MSALYGIAQGSLAASANYALNYASANLTVTQRAITVTADAKSRAYGDANPALTYQVGGSGLANGDTLSGALATSATTVQRCRRLRHHAGDAGGLIELRLRLCWSEPHGYAGGGPSRTDRRTRSLREVAGGFARAAAARADARAREHRAIVSRNRLQIQAMP